MEELRHSVNPEIIVNEWLIDGMKIIGELFGRTNVITICTSKCTKL